MIKRLVHYVMILLRITNKEEIIIMSDEKKDKSIKVVGFGFEFRYVKEADVDSYTGWIKASKAECDAQARTVMKKDPRTILIKRVK